MIFQSTSFTDDEGGFGFVSFRVQKPRGNFFCRPMVRIGLETNGWSSRLWCKHVVTHYCGNLFR